ncbi:biotin transporter BioY [Lentilactobacillus hilgardii]|uniref:Biotin transporter n=1 Tax=Lentilactobacillus hilgardii (strain ATCC 8290 / DSM 20176 / CCUG 30140 / JCM 1155 / KCTC 3500 / NBRC 15886 / NCIMB 8040 / NRRL B-1843 / 9) TaxID=1423757 RepID=C0XHR0_LENH9|nr:biotin transporter BioY [Lentilactobacillus hilgardii]EEI25192.1 BioY family protein [Lentilactobacillus hilgardii DSM 20176 = ATCC 8290]KRK59313.1 biotin biosynthesis protein [Lentilactobacillus hilgardii DSM 20176 = ATCC 8290]QEU39095.1 biotin transporter BioY [Lentilactobacillus hilgardii]TDG83237.1 hypothetical protein C5L34_000812 [Lentilactobacillus hilgardii]
MKIREITQIALVTAVIIVLGMIPPIPLGFIPVPIVLQNLGIMIAGIVLGPKRGTVSVALFLFLALIGFPVLSGGQAGPAAFVGPTGGYLVGWLLTPALVWSSMSFKFMKQSWEKMTGAWIGAVLIVDIIGSLWLTIGSGMPLISALLSNLVFIPGDTLKVVVACLVGQRVRIPKINQV